MEDETMLMAVYRRLEAAERLADEDARAARVAGGETRLYLEGRRDGIGWALRVLYEEDRQAIVRRMQSARAAEAEAATR